MSAAAILAMPTAIAAPSGDIGAVAPADDGAFAGMVAAENATAEASPPATASTAPAEPAPAVAAPNQVHALISAALAFALQPRPASTSAFAESTSTGDGEDEALVAPLVMEDQPSAASEPTVGAPEMSAETQGSDTEQSSTDVAALPQPAVLPMPEPAALAAQPAKSGEATDRLAQAVAPHAPSPLDTAPIEASPTPADERKADSSPPEAPAVADDAAPATPVVGLTTNAAQVIAKALAVLNTSPAQTLPTLGPELVTAPVVKNVAVTLTASEPTVPTKAALPAETPLTKISQTEAKTTEGTSSPAAEGTAAARTSPVADKVILSGVVPAIAKPTESAPQTLAPSIEAIETATTPAATLAQPSSAPASTAVTAQASTLSHLSQATIDTTAQIAAQISKTLAGRSTRFEMGLTPEGLGRVDVSLEIDASGQLAARLAFDNPLAATELRGRVDDLRRELQDAGFTIARDGLEFAERQSSSGGGFDRRQGRAFASASRIAADADLATPTPAAWTSLSLTPRGVDLKV